MDGTQSTYQTVYTRQPRFLPAPNTHTLQVSATGRLNLWRLSLSGGTTLKHDNVTNLPKVTEFGETVLAQVHYLIEWSSKILDDTKMSFEVSWNRSEKLNRSNSYFNTF